MRSPNRRRISRTAGSVMSGASISEPATAQGTTRAVEIGSARRSSPSHIALAAVRRRHAPDVLGVSRELLPKPQQKRLLRVGRHDRILKPVRMRRLALTTSTKIDPRMRVLVHEQRWRTSDIGELVESDHRSPPGAPGLGGNGVGRGRNRHEVEDHQLAVVIPPRLKES